MISCATRPDVAPIENGTVAPSYLQTNKTVAPPVERASSEEQPSTMGSLSSDDAPIKQTIPDAPKPLIAPPNANADQAPVTVTTASVSDSTSGFIMPTDGKTDGYKSSTKGIDIYGKEGQAVRASNAGKVVYSGNGLKNYGNLIIIKHSEVYLTAYAHNKNNLVKEGATVKRGQKIAEMGHDDNNKAVLHFELRKNGKPVDPFTLISKGQ